MDSIALIVLLSVSFLGERIPPSKKQQTSEIYKACFDISQRVQHFFAVTQRNKNQQFYICHRPVGLLTCRLYGRHACELYDLITHKLDKPPYCLSMLWQFHHLQTTNETLGLCSSEHSKVCFQPLQMN